MSFRIKNKSQFSQIVGSNAKRENGFDLKCLKSAYECCAVNPKFLAVIVESGGGAFLVLPLAQTGRVLPEAPLVTGHKGPVLDIAWCPHNDNVIASASEDCYVKVWQIPDEGLTSNMADSVVDLLKHQRRVMLVLWHPSAENILLSAGSDNNVIIWNVGNGEALNVITLPDLVYSGSWNWDGSEIIFSCKDQKFRRINPRSGEIIEEAPAHEGNKPTRAIYLKNGQVFTTGFSKDGMRQFSLRTPGRMDNPNVINELDSLNGIMLPMYDAEASLIYLCGKGDTFIRFFEVNNQSPFVHYINTFKSSDPQRGISFMPKRGCDVTTCEISRFYRFASNGFCQMIPFVVPRKSELFQEDLYPDTVSDVPAITAEEWWDGTNAEPNLISMSVIGNQAKKQEDLVVKKMRMIEKGKPATSATDETAMEVVAMDEVSHLLSEMELKMEQKFEEFKTKIRKRIRALEADVQELREQQHKHAMTNGNDEDHLEADEV